MHEFKPVSKDDRYIYELMPLLIGIGPDENLLCYGSCFIAYPHMAVTAKHVIEELFRQDPNIVAGKPSKFEYWVAQVVWNNDEPDYVVWTIDSIATSPHSDIAVIWLKSFNDKAAEYKQWKVVPTTFDPPAIGATIRAFGLHNVRFDGSRVNGERKFEHIEVNCDRSVSTGIVRDHYWAGRDRGLYNFPCFEVNARMEHGMSGGLVINDHSEVCGIVCGSLPPISDDQEHVSYVTMLWPMMAILAPQFLVPQGVEAKTYRMQQLSARGIFQPIGWDRVVIDDKLSSSGPLNISYKLIA